MRQIEGVQSEMRRSLTIEEAGRARASLRLLAVAAFALAAPALPAAPQAAPSGIPQAAPAGVELSIRFFDKRIYFTDSEILLKIGIANNSASTWRFRLADDLVHSLSFEARSPTNRALDPSDAYRLALGESRPVLYREIAIKPGEEYSLQDRLERFIRIDGPGSFAVKALLWPELAGESASAPVASNVLMLTVRPSPGLPPASEAVRAVTGEVLRAQALPPDEVVRRTIVARQKGLWNEFFLYLDLESLLSRNEDQKRLYDRESDDGRRRMLDRYRADLQTSVVDNDIVVQPYYFEILETRYTQTKGIVRVLEKFQSQQLRLVKEYSYELSRRDDVWFIMGYSVFNKGTE